MSSLQGKNVFITGASAGIGEACAELFAQQGANLVLLARRQDRLEALAKRIQSSHPSVRVHCLAFDLQNQIDDISKLPESIPNEFLPVHVLVNNAGLAFGRDKAHVVSEQDIVAMLDINVRALMFLTKAFLPQMLENREGHVINVGSVAGIWGYPGGSIYCASKFAVQGYTDALRHDLVDTPIRVTLISPGMVQTEFSLVRCRGDAAAAKAVYDGMAFGGALTARDVAETIVFAASRPKHVQIGDIVMWPTCQSGVTSVHREQK